MKRIIKMKRINKILILFLAVIPNFLLGFDIFFRSFDRTQEYLYTIYPEEFNVNNLTGKNAYAILSKVSGLPIHSFKLVRDTHMVPNDDTIVQRLYHNNLFNFVMIPDTITPEDRDGRARTAAASMAASQHAQRNVIRTGVTGLKRVNFALDPTGMTNRAYYDLVADRIRMPVENFVIKIDGEALPNNDSLLSREFINKLKSIDPLDGYKAPSIPTIHIRSTVKKWPTVETESDEARAYPDYDRYAGATGAAAGSGAADAVSSDDSACAADEARAYPDYARYAGATGAAAGSGAVALPGMTNNQTEDIATFSGRMEKFLKENAVYSPESLERLKEKLREIDSEGADAFIKKIIGLSEENQHMFLKKKLKSFIK